MAWTAPSTWVSGAILTAAQLNTQLRDNMLAIGDAWTSYTPTWTNVTVGNATQASAYMNAGKLYVVRISLTFGSTTSISGTPDFTLPGGVSVISGYSSFHVFGTGGLLDTSDSNATYLSPIVRTTTADKLRFLSMNTAGTYAKADGVSATVPFTWATGDMISGTFTFQAA